MAVARPLSDETPAEDVFCAVVDAQADDLSALRARWPDRTSPESLALQERLRQRVGPGGEAEAAMGAVHAVYGGPDRVPRRVRSRLEGYIRFRLGGGPRPEAS